MQIAVALVVVLYHIHIDGRTPGVHFGDFEGNGVQHRNFVPDDHFVDHRGRGFSVANEQTIWRSDAFYLFDLLRCFGSAGNRSY